MTTSIPNHTLSLRNLSALLNVSPTGYVTKTGVSGVALPRRGQDYPQEAAFMRALTAEGNEMYWGLLTNWDGRLDYNDLVSLSNRRRDFNFTPSITANDIDDFIEEARPIQSDYDFFSTMSSENLSIELQLRQSEFLENHPID